MNWNTVQKKLLAAARAEPADDRVPYAFEQRILARLPARLVADRWADWAAALWKAAVPCVVLGAALSLWSSVDRRQDAAEAAWAVAFENAVLTPEEEVETAW
jgi:transposase